MKNILKSISIIAILILVILPFEKHSNNPYSGKYYYDDNTNITIELKDNNSFVLTQTFGKDSECFRGKYSINDNNVQLKFDNKNEEVLYKDLLSGKVEGSIIYIKNSEKTFHLIKL